MSVESWANAARRAKHRQTPEEQRAIDAFQGLLEGKSTPNIAAGTISLLYEPLLKGSPNSAHVRSLWEILCDAVRAFGGSKDLSERLLDLLDSISQLPDVTDEHGNAIISEWKHGVFWRSLPELPIMFREYAIYIEPEDEMEGDWFDQAVPLLNATTFGAMYLARGKDHGGMAYHAEISLMQGIEGGCQTPDMQRCAAMYVPPAATWILLAGERIYELCKSDFNRNDSRKGMWGDRGLWGRGRGYSMGRWALWKKTFGEIATTQGLPDGVKDLAAKATSEMDKIESEMK